MENAILETKFMKILIKFNKILEAAKLRRDAGGARVEEHGELAEDDGARKHRAHQRDGLQKIASFAWQAGARKRTQSKPTSLVVEKFRTFKKLESRPENASNAKPMCRSCQT